MRNLNWYDLNEERSWPIADQATMIDDTGKRMPNNLVADLNLWFPETNGQSAFVSSITVSANIATVTILSNTGIALAAVSVATPISPYKHYKLEALANGVGGWIVFGSAVNEPELKYFKFSNSTQSVLIPQVCRRYTAAPVTDVARLGNVSTLSGLIKLKGGDDIEIVKEQREINNVVVDVAVVRLKKKPEFVDDVNIYEKYAGDCGKRPESNNCSTVPPIEYINSVSPDCCGNITIEFRGCADVKFMQNESSSVAIGCSIGLTEACVTADKLPDENGKLPNEYTDLCVTESIISSESSLVDNPDLYVVFSVDNGYVQFADTYSLDPRLPFIQDFSNRQSQGFETLAGRFDIVSDSEHSSFGGYSLQSRSGGRCLSLWVDEQQSLDWTTYYKTALLHFSLRRGPLGILHNAGLVFNFDKQTNTGWGIELDHEGTFTGFKGLRLVKYSPAANITYASVPVRNSGLNTQYSIALSILPAAGGGAWIKADLCNNEPENSGQRLFQSLGPFLVADYGAGNGHFGVTSYRAITQFNRLIVDNAEELK